MHIITRFLPTDVTANTTASLINGQITSGVGSTSPRSGVTPSAIPEATTVQGVSPNYEITPSKPNESNLVWFYMRVAYGQEKKVRDYLLSVGVEVFHPTWKKERVIAGVKKLVEVSLIPNALFVHSTANIMKKYVGKEPTPNLHYFYEPHFDKKRKPIGTGRRPIILPDYQMQSFQIWTSSQNLNKIFLDIDQFNFKQNDFVRITNGEFKGFVGVVVRLQGQTRVGILIEGVGFISTAYVPKTYLQLVSDEINAISIRLNIKE